MYCSNDIWVAYLQQLMQSQKVNCGCLLNQGDTNERALKHADLKDIICGLWQLTCTSKN